MNEWMNMTQNYIKNNVIWTLFHLATPKLSKPKLRLTNLVSIFVHISINVTRYKCSFKHGNINKPLSQHTCKTNYTDICFAGFIDIQTQENMFLEERRTWCYTLQCGPSSIASGQSATPSHSWPSSRHSFVPPHRKRLGGHLNSRSGPKRKEINQCLKGGSLV